MGLLPARALQNAGLLHSLHMDLRLPRLGESCLRLFGIATGDRRVPGVPPDKVHSHPAFFLLARARRRLVERQRDTSHIDRLLFGMVRQIAARCDAPDVCGGASWSVEFFSGRRRTVLEQFAPPRLVEAQILRSEATAFPGWALPLPSGSTPVDYRIFEEWSMASAVWAPSQFVIDCCIGLGLEARETWVIPYPIPDVSPQLRRPRDRRGSPRGRLKIVYAGSLTLLKGAQYIYEAFRGWRTAQFIDLHFYGPSSLSPLAIERLRSVGTVHGAVPRDALIRAFADADALLFPSLSEGSALVTLEATATGLPVIATSASGAPDSAMIIVSNSGAAIRDAIESILDDPALAARMSYDGLGVAARRTEMSFQRDFAAAVMSIR